ncbi:hypothetical protein pb186bvf_004520 [Paramecium bursaria]
MQNNGNDEMQIENPQPTFNFFNISKLSKGSLQRYQTFYQKEEPFINGDQPLEQKVQSHFEKLKLDDKQVLEKFLKLKKDDFNNNRRQPRIPKANPRT